MDFIINIGMLIFGFVFLIKGANLFVDASSSIALKIGVSPLVIGLTLVAFGTSLPEFAVSFVSAITASTEGGNADIALGNIIGSNIANTTLILGLSAVFTPVAIASSMKKVDIPVLLLVSTLFLTSIAYLGSTYIINFYEGIVFLLIFVYYMRILMKRKEIIDEVPHVQLTTQKALLYIASGLSGVVIGGYLVTISAEMIATTVLVNVLNMNPLKVTALVGLTIVALGTSLPELVTSVVAAKKGQSDIALGNVIGSNIFNVLLVIGLSSLFVPLVAQKDMIIDSAIALLIIIIIYIWSQRSPSLKKHHGFTLIAIYLVYTVYIIIRALV
jgi:cation:H+ antiporter